MNNIVYKVLDISVEITEALIHYGGRIECFSRHPDCKTILGVDWKEKPYKREYKIIMSLFDNVENAQHTFVGWAAAEYKKFYKIEAEIKPIADMTFEWAIAALQVIADRETNATAKNEIQTIITNAQRSMMVVSALVNDFGPNPTAQSMLVAVKDVLAKLLTSGSITNTTHVSVLQKIVGSVDDIGQKLGAPVTPPTAT